jgi:hypothetical protein
LGTRLRNVLYRRTPSYHLLNRSQPLTKLSNEEITRLEGQNLRCLKSEFIAVAISRNSGTGLQGCN